MTTPLALQHVSQYKIILVEDSDSERCLLLNLLDSMGFTAQGFSNAQEALEHLQNEHVDMVITDWIMPQISGIELCQTIKSMPCTPYTILLTGNNQNAHIVEGIESGADDFIAKPFHSGVLKVRILAGLRIIEMQHKLTSHNKTLSQMLVKEQDYLNCLKQDLSLAAQLQRALLPKNSNLSEGWRVTTEFKPAQDLAGDLFQCFNIDQQHIGFYLLDVSGHGTAASMLSFTLAHHLSSNQKVWQSLDVARITNNLNRQFDDPEQCGRFATLLIGIANTRTGEVEIINAGHPSPIIVSPSGAKFVDDSYIESHLPIGINKQHNYQSQHFTLEKEQQLLLYSDGIYECRHSKFGSFGLTKLLKNVSDARELPAEKLLHYLCYSTELWQEKQAQDDISLMLISATNNLSHCRYQM
ncbi:SpoIIE family protein phosphatase [Shewanella sp. Isolate13]|uniref:SpoIIE family protein phosphatase n=1 Tax=Shewanella sp. Isolate13 TaxID=2908531 RepID=UPI001EFE31CF|nr:SpoIIE family protein phosphatase [Shewanella sp. Isolate13]MCG9730990.1 SpoIIE family protein phosphatase [Shewanella sp. Isolate13]